MIHFIWLANVDWTVHKICNRFNFEAVATHILCDSDVIR